MAIEPRLTPPDQGTPTAIIHGHPGQSVMDLDATFIEASFRENGALLVRGFDLDPASFELFAQRLCPVSVLNESPDRRSLEKDSSLQTVNLGVDPFPLHPELSREPWRPDACLFACFDPPASDGQTTVCDGIGIVERLPDELVKEMQAHRLLYMQQAPAELLQYWLGNSNPDDATLAAPPTGCPYWFRRIAGGRIIRGFSRSLLHRPMFDNRLAFGNFLLFAQDYLHQPNYPCLDNGRPMPAAWMAAVRAAAEPITYAHSWQRGDVLILDNSRFMHGRRMITDPRARRIASFFGYLPFAPESPEEPVDPIWRRQAFVPPVVTRLRA